MTVKSREIEQGLIAFYSGDLELTKELWDLIYSEWISNGKKTLHDADVRRLQAKLASRTELSKILADQFDQYRPEIIQLAEGILRLCDGKNYLAVKAATNIVLDFSRSTSFVRIDALKSVYDRPNDALPGVSGNDTVV